MVVPETRKPRRRARPPRADVSDFVKIADTQDIPSGGMKLVDVNGQRVAVANVGGSFYAFSDECTHDGGPLSEGDLEGEIVTCPWHFSRFNVTTGEIVESPAEEVVLTYELKVEDGAVYVGAPRGEGPHPPVTG
jgi:nitrite reductase/ring-hydroxylating ferredoxin subunit